MAGIAVAIIVMSRATRKTLMTMATRIGMSFACSSDEYKSAYVSEYDHNDELCLAVWLVFITTHPVGIHAALDWLERRSDFF